MTDITGLAAAIFSAIATAFAAFATWRSPLAAARLAEMMRRTAEVANRRYDKKMELFTTLMSERPVIYHESGARALNLIDVVFNESRDVRDAWLELLRAYEPSANTPVTAQRELLQKLLGVMAKDIRLPDQQGLDRVYFPKALADELAIRTARRAQEMQQIFGSQPDIGLWPPPPE